MAKGKHSTALFEVINRPARSGVNPPPVVTRAPLKAPLSGAAHNAAPGDPAATVHVDRDRHQISFRVSYTSAFVTLFAVLVVVGLAYLVGRGLNSDTPEVADSSTTDTSTEQLKSGPANPDVLNPSTPASPSTPTPAANVAPMRTAGPVAAPTSVRRIVGQNYVIMQSYPEEEQAKEAQAVLLAAGIPCTVEKGPAGWAQMSWFSVIGTQSFDRITRNPDLDAYVKAVQNVNKGVTSKFKKLDPRVYKWKEPASQG